MAVVSIMNASISKFQTIMETHSKEAPPDHNKDDDYFDASTSKPTNDSIVRNMMGYLDQSQRIQHAQAAAQRCGLERGGVWNSTFLMCNAAVGGGVLTLPYVFVLSGYASGYALLAASAVAGMWSNLILVQAAFCCGATTYDQLVKRAGGRPL